jgi:carbonic anhydrase
MQPWPLFPDPTAAPSWSASRQLHRPDPAEALARLRAGNDRFRFAVRASGGHNGANAAPYAVVVGCIDPRVPVESVFAQGIGAICVVRSAGHVLDRAVVGSVEFAVTDLNVSLVVVLGHDDCRAIATAVEALGAGRRPTDAHRYLIDQIGPAIPQDGTGRHNLDRVTHNHIHRTVAALSRAEHIHPAVATGRVNVVGAIYHLNNGYAELL